MRPQSLVLPPPQPPPPSSSSPGTSFPILAISILGILATSILLLGYYVFAIKCTLNWRRSNSLGRFARSGRRLYWRTSQLPGAHAYSAGAAAEHRGLEESAIQAIPTLKYRKISERSGANPSAVAFHECAVCLNEFQEEERIRMLPSCFHVFHIDCIDTWLQTHASCPLCRSSITSSIPAQADALIAALFLYEDPRGGEDMVIEVRGADQSEDLADNAVISRAPVTAKSPPRRLSQMNSMGDECIEAIKPRNKVEQPMRRSFSVDSFGDARLCVAVQKILQRDPRFRDVAMASIDGESGGGGGSCTSSRLRWSFFSFGRSSRGASVLPVQFMP